MMRKDAEGALVLAVDVGSKSSKRGLSRVETVLNLAFGMVLAFRQRVQWVKIGLQMYTAIGPLAIATMRSLGFKVFLDLKLHDIPETVEGAAFEATMHGIGMLTVHASGGRAMICAARNGIDEAYDKSDRTFPKPILLAVTVLTSLQLKDLEETWNTKFESVEAAVVHLTNLAIMGGADGIVCSGEEATAVRQAAGDSFVIVVPGTRLPGAEKGSQARSVTPGEACRAGANYLVLGRGRDQFDQVVDNMMQSVS